MKPKNIVILAILACALGAAAYFCGSGRRIKTPSLNGRPVVTAFDLADVARIDIAGPKPLAIAAGTNGWVVESYHGYPADTGKIRENLLRLAEAKVGQEAKGVDFGAPVEVNLRDAAGKTVASASLGAKHMAKPKGGMAMMYGGYPDGRYMAYDGRMVLVKDALEAFDGDPMAWCDQKLLDTPYVRFTGIVDDSAADYGFATGTVCTVTYKGDTNAVARVGGTVPSGSDRYFKLDAERWVFTIPSYSADSLVKPKDPPKAD